MVNYININGKYFDESAWVFKSNNRSFLYGDGVFESMKYTMGQLLWYEDHWERLKNGCGYLGYRLGLERDKAFFLNEIEHTIRKNKIYSAARVRLHIFRNEGGLYTPTENEASFIISVNSLEPDLLPLNETGLKIDIFEKEYKSLSSFASLKSANALLYVLAGLEKVDKKMDELVILNQRDRVCESVSSNIYLVSSSTIYTPSLQAGCIHGVMRVQIIKLAKKLGIEVIESDDISVDLLPEADECFLTNAIHGIQWVSAYKNKRYYNEMSSKLSYELNQVLTSSK